MLLIQPSSAAAERVFSLLNSMSSQQRNSLEDYIAAYLLWSAITVLKESTSPFLISNRLIVLDCMSFFHYSFGSQLLVVMWIY